MRFINMLMNDTTFLLDESLDSLKVRFSCVLCIKFFVFDNNVYVLCYCVGKLLECNVVVFFCFCFCSGYMKFKSYKQIPKNGMHLIKKVNRLVLVNYKLMKDNVVHI